MTDEEQAYEQRKNVLRNKLRDTDGNPPCDGILNSMLIAEDVLNNLTNNQEDQ